MIEHFTPATWTQFNSMLIAIFGLVGVWCALQMQRLWMELRATRREQATAREQQRIRDAVEILANGQLHRTADARTRSTDDDSVIEGEVTPGAN
jgi:hypothetical protein